MKNNGSTLIEDTLLEVSKPKRGRKATVTASKDPVSVTERVSAPKIRQAEFRITGTSPLVIHAFSAKTAEQMRATQEAGQQAKGKRKRDPKDFEALFNNARHIGATPGKPKDTWDGFHASAIRNGMISACKLVGFVMTRARLSVWAESDGIDVRTGDPLIRIYGKPEMNISPARNDNGSVDLRSRPMYREWSAKVRISWDEDQFSLNDLTNLLVRVGMQVGIGEGRFDSKKSNGLGWGCFRVEV